MSRIDISRKVLIITLLIFAVLTAAFTLTHSMQLSNFLELEQTNTLQDVGKVRSTVSTQQGYLDYINQDWAYWDDTYKFIDDRNQNYTNVNLQNQTLAGIKVNVMLFVNNSGSVVYAKSVDIYTAMERPVPEELLKMVEKGSLSQNAEERQHERFLFCSSRTPCLFPAIPS